jgi:hypothetical protein
LFADEWQQNPSRQYNGKQGGEIYMVLADHPRPNICEAEIKEKPDGQRIPKFVYSVMPNELV